MPTLFHPLRLLLPILLVPLLLTGCDSSGDEGSGGGSDLTITGRVTDDTGYAKKLNVEGAVVTAATVDAAGELTRVEGQTRTNERGEYELGVSSTSDLMVVSASKDDFRTSVVASVSPAGTGPTEPATMTSESHAEAGAFIAAKQSDADEVSPADVALHVDAAVAAEVRAGTTTPEAIAEVVVESVQAELAANGGIDADRVRRMKASRYIALQSGLSGGGQPRAAVYSFQEAFATLYDEFDASPVRQARSMQTHAAMSLQSRSDISAAALFGLRQQAQILAGAATAHAIEARMEAAGLDDSWIDAAADARVDLLLSIREASSITEMTNAAEGYAGTIRSTLTNALGTTASVTAGGRSVVQENAVPLRSLIQLGTSATATASAFGTFYEQAAPLAETAMGATTDPALGADVLVMLGAYEAMQPEGRSGI